MVTFRNVLISLLFILSFTILFNFCSEDSPTKPTEDDNNNSVNISNVIGPAGGELKDSSFTLFVPDGCFLNDANITLKINEEYFLNDNQNTSETYVLGGIPNNFSKKIRIAIKYNDVLGDSNFIAIATTQEDFFSTDSLYSFNFVLAKDSSGFLVAEIESSAFNSHALNKLLQPSNSDWIYAMFKVVPDAERNIIGNVDIFYPISMRQEVNLFAERVDNILNIFLNDFGFDYKYNNELEKLNDAFSHHWMWPARIFVISELNLELKKLMRKRYGENKINFFVHQDFIGETYSRPSSIAYAFEFLKIAEQTYNANHIRPQGNLFNAIKLWLETYLYPLSFENPPSYLSENNPAWFNGFYAEDISTELATLIKYLIDYQNFEVTSFGQIFEDAHLNNKNHYVSLISNVENFIITWFPDYYQKYISGKIFNINSSDFLPSYSYWKINSTEDTLIISTPTFDDLSAKKYLIELNHEFENESASLLLDAHKANSANNDGIATIVFGVNGSNNLSHVVTARGQTVEIQNLKGYFQNGIKKFFVVIVNCLNDGASYEGQSEIEFVTKVKQERYNRCMVWYQIEHSLNEILTGSDGTQETEEYNSTVGRLLTFEGEIIDNKFESNYEEEINGQTHSGTLSITLNEEVNIIETFSMTHFTNNNSTTIPTYLEGRIDGNNLYFDNNNSGRALFSAYGNTLCSSITFSDYNSVSKYYSSSGELNKTWEVTTNSYYCDQNSLIEISFWKE